jgi:hypothetical protein
MPAHDTRLEKDEYRLILLRSGHHTIWAQARDGRPHLPRIAIPRWQRPAEQLQQAVETRLHLPAVVLDILPGANDLSPCAIVEIRSSGTADGLVAAVIDEVLEKEMTDHELEIVQTILSGDKRPRRPFCRLGWMDEAFHWTRQMAGLDIVFTGKIRQFNAAGDSTLVHFATHEGSGYWLKATGKPNAHEFRITKMLAVLCPEYLPPRIADREDWNAWLMKDAGCSLEWLDLPYLELTVSSMAVLQQRTMRRTTEFQAAGASDQRLRILRAHLVDIIEYLDEAMKKQISTKAPRVETYRLRDLASILDDACCCMDALGIPDTLVHNDMNRGNILFEGMHCAFTDWCEVCISNPFLGFEYLCLLTPRSREGWSRTLREVYRRSWLDHLDAAQIDEALVLAPLLAILAHLHGRVAGSHRPRRLLPHVESYARTLARRMDRAAQDTQLLEVLCS